MRVLLFLFLGLIIFIAVAVIAQYQIETTSKKLGQEIYQVENALIEKKWKAITTHLNSIKERWEKTKPFWSLLLHHQEIDSIDQALIRTMKAAKIKDYSETHIELGGLQFFLRHIPEREKFNFVNVF